MAIIAIAGLPGSGKTYWMTRQAWKIRKERPARRLVSNYPIYLPGEPVELVDTFDDCYDLQHCELFLDEMHLWASSRNWAKSGDQRRAFLSQLRKIDVNLWYTSQDLSSVDKEVRDRTFLSFQCESWRALGFFWYSGYFGCKVDKKKKYVSSWYLLTDRIASLYDTEYVVK